MIGLDTNIVVRYLAQDDVQQCKKVNRLIENELNSERKGYISLITLVEVVWVLETCYDQKKAELIAVIEGLLATKQFSIQRADIAYLALKAYRNGSGDFSDALIVAIALDAGCEKVLTFDKKAISLGMELLSK